MRDGRPVGAGARDTLSRRAIRWFVQAEKGGFQHEGEKQLVIRGGLARVIARSVEAGCFMA